MIMKTHNMTFKNSFLFLLIAILSLAVGFTYLYPQISTTLTINALSKHQVTAETMDVKEYLSEIVVNMDEMAQYENKRYILSAVVKNVTKQGTNDLERTILWTKFLQDKIVHPKRTPLLENGQAVYDPIWILSHKMAQCGQTNQLILDGLETIGI